MRLKTKYLILLTWQLLLFLLLLKIKHNVTNLVKRTEYNTKISEIENKMIPDHDHDKYITT